CAAEPARPLRPPERLDRGYPLLVRARPERARLDGRDVLREVRRLRAERLSLRAATRACRTRPPRHRCVSRRAAGAAPAPWNCAACAGSRVTPDRQQDRTASAAAPPP